MPFHPVGEHKQRVQETRTINCFHGSTFFFNTEWDNHVESDSETVCVMRTKNKTNSPEPVPHTGSLRPPRARDVWSHHRRGNAVSRARKRRLHGLHRMRHACSVRFLIRGNSWRARAMANALTNPPVSSDQRPPTSRATTRAKECHRACPLAVLACHRGATHTPW